MLEEYGADVYLVLSDAVEDVAAEAAEKLQSVDRFAPGGHPTGKYSKTWTADSISTGLLQKKAVVHNSENYQLTHLLEKGHVIRNGTRRVFGRVPAYPHVKPVEEWVKTELPNKVVSMLNDL